MTFLNPSGLWLLLGVPALIIIYLIKSKYDDRVVSSTYIWKLSSRLAKKRLPIQRIRKILMFIFQLIIISAAAFIAAKPTVEGGQSRDYVAIIDTSAGMMIKDEEGVSRLDKALEMVDQLAENVDDGHTLSIILAGNEPVCLAKGVKTVSEARMAIEKISPTFGGCDLDAACRLAEDVAAQLFNPVLTFYTDRGYSIADNVEVVDLSRGEWNVSFLGLNATSSKAGTVFHGQLISYNRDAAVTIGLKIDGKAVDAQVVKCLDEKPTPFSFELENVFEYSRAEVYVEEEDGLAEDNFYALCPINSRDNKVLLVSGAPFYISNVLESTGICHVTHAPSLEGVELSGYDLYIFDGVAPEEYPKDGSCVIFNVKNLPNGLTGVATDGNAYRLKVAEGVDNPIVRDIVFSETVVKDCLSLIGDGKWQSLVTCNGKTVVSTSKWANGMKCTVFSFDLHNSNLPLKPTFPVLINNLVKYSLPSLVGEKDIGAGQLVEVNRLSGSQSASIMYPDGVVEELTFVDDSCSVLLDRVGVYTVAAFNQGQAVRYEEFFVHIDAAELDEVMGERISVIPVPLESDLLVMARSPVWFWFAVLMLILLLVEWGWYYYEQY